MEWIKKLLTPSPEKLLKPLYRQADAIDALEPTYEKLTDDQLREKTNELRTRAQGGEELDALLPEAFAARARGQQARALGMRPYPRPDHRRVPYCIRAASPRCAPARAKRCAADDARLS